jgi:hypothetical protein
MYPLLLLALAGGVALNEQHEHHLQEHFSEQVLQSLTGLCGHQRALHVPAQLLDQEAFLC